MDSLSEDHEQGAELDSLRDVYGMLDIEQIRSILPHRYPFLLVDRILNMEPGVRARGLKNVTINEEFFQGHFPGHAIMPGVLIIEAMAQVGAVLLLSSPERRGKLAYFAAIDEVKFKKPVLPGDSLIIEVQVDWARGKVGRVSAVSYVDDNVVAEGKLSFAVRERDEPARPEPQQLIGVGK